MSYAHLLQNEVLSSSYWKVLNQLYDPIEQQVEQQTIVLQRCSGKAAAVKFLGFLQSPQSRNFIAKSGYLLPNNKQTSAETAELAQASND